MPGMLSDFNFMPAGLLGSFLGKGRPLQTGLVDPNPLSTKQRLMNFIQSPEALGLSMGLLEAGEPSFTHVPTLSGGFRKGIENVLKIKAEQAKHGGLEGKFGKALSDYNAILNAYGPDHEYTKLAKQNLDNLAAGNQGISFEFDPATGAYTLGMGGTGGSKKAQTGPRLSGEGEDRKIRTPATPATTTDIQTQKIARKRAEILNPYLEHPYMGSGTNMQLAKDLLEYRKNPTPELREKLVKLAIANKLVSYGATLNLLSEGGGVGESATKRQEAAVKQGWAEGAGLALKNMPKDIIAEANAKAAKIKDKISSTSEKEFATGFPIDLPNETETEALNETSQDEQKITEMSSFPTEKAAVSYLQGLGVSLEKMKAVAKKRGLTLQQLADQVLMEKSKR